MGRALIVAGALLAGCGQQSPAATPATIARVGSIEITQHQLDIRRQGTLAALAGGGAPSSDAAMQSKVMVRVFRSLIFDTVIAQEAAFLHLAAGDAEVDAGAKQAETDAGGRPQLETQLAAAGETDDALRDNIRSRLNEQRVEDYYAKDRVFAILHELAGGADFAALAGQVSDSPDSAGKKGALGVLTDDQVKAQLGASVLAALVTLPVGQHTAKAIRTNSGYEIVRIDNIVPSGRSLQEILVAAPQPYTVRERPSWFDQQVFQAILHDCQQHRIQVFIKDAGANPCDQPLVPRAGASPRVSATP